MATERKDGRWMARKMVEGHRITAYGKTAELAEENLKALIEPAPLEALTQLGDCPTLHEIAVSEWFPMVQTREPETQRRYTDLYIRHVRDFIGHLPVTEIGPRLISAWLKELAARKVTDNTRSLARDRAKQILDCACRLEYIEHNPCDKITVPVAREMRVRVLPVAKAQEVLDGLLNTELSAPTYMAMLLGLRLGEIVAAEWSRLDRQQRSLLIDRQRQITFKTPGVKGKQLDQTKKPKGGKVRLLRLPQWVIEGLDARGNLDSVFICTKDGKQWRNATLSEHWMNARGKFGLPDWTFHDLRHAAAGLLIAGGCSLLEVAAVLGHSSIKTTERYVELTEEGKRGIIEKLPVLR